MRDDSSVHRLRISLGWLKILLAFIILLLIFGSVAIWLSTNLWFENRQLRTEAQALKQETSLLHVRLERLSTFEKILQNTDPKEVSDMLSRISIMQGRQAAVSAAEATANGTQSAGSSASGATEAASLLPVVVPQSPPAGTPALPQPLNEGKVALENLSARLVNSNADIELAYEMANLSNSRVEGRVILHIVTQDNDIIPLPLRSSASLFAMTSRKIVPRFTVSLPEKARGGAVVSLMVEMFLEDHLSTRSIHTLPIVPE